MTDQSPTPPANDVHRLIARLREALESPNVYPQNGRYHQPSVAVMEAARALLEALSSPPADDVREALAQVFVAHLCDPFPAREVTEDDRRVVDAVLAVFEVRPRGTITPTPEEWAAQMDAERARQIEHGYDDEHDAEHGVDHLLKWAIDYARRGNNLAAATMARCALRLPREPITDTEVVRAAYAIFTHGSPWTERAQSIWDATPEYVRAEAMKTARAALEAARKAQ